MPAHSLQDRRSPVQGVFSLHPSWGCRKNPACHQRLGLYALLLGMLKSFLGPFLPEPVGRVGRRPGRVVCLLTLACHMSAFSFLRCPLLSHVHADCPSHLDFWKSFSVVISLLHVSLYLHSSSVLPCQCAVPLCWVFGSCILLHCQACIDFRWSSLPFPFYFREDIAVRIIILSTQEIYFCSSENFLSLRHSFPLPFLPYPVYSPHNRIVSGFFGSLCFGGHYFIFYFLGTRD